MRTKEIQILECTLRDGSYSIDFKFTLQDTALLAKLLCDVGFKYIEVAHGVGLGAARAGKGQPPWLDEEAVRVAKSTVGDKALIGVFCIPGIATFDDMKRAVDAGLDFVRIGQNAPEDIHTVIPYIKEARKLGITPVINFMKSYGITPQDFGERAKIVANEGVQIVYVVDSAGGMFPEQIAKYFDEVREKTDIKMGLHAHNNLHLAVANSIEAVRHGATFIDATLYGIGRSAGNSPTEVIIAVMENLGYKTGVNLFRVMDIAEAYMKPLISQVQMYDMMAVTAGYSLFHSSYLPKVIKMAKKYDVELRHLVAAMGKTDPINCPDEILENLAMKLSREEIQTEEQKEILISFSAPGISPQKISNTMKAVEILIDGLVVSSGKRQCEPVLDLVPTNEPEDNMVLTEFLIDDYDAVLGRIHFGSEKVLEDVLLLAKNKVARALVDVNAGKWINCFQVFEKVQSIWKTKRVYFYSSFLLECHHLLNVLGCAAKEYGRESILLFGDDKRMSTLLPEIENLFERIMVPSDIKIPLKISEEKLFLLPSSEAELRHINIKVNVVLCSLFTSAEMLARLSPLVRPEGVFISIPHFVGMNLTRSGKEKAIHTISVDFADAYRGLVSRISRIESTISKSEGIIND